MELLILAQLLLSMDSSVYLPMEPHSYHTSFNLKQFMGKILAQGIKPIPRGNRALDKILAWRELDHRIESLQRIELDWDGRENQYASLADQNFLEFMQCLGSVLFECSSKELALCYLVLNQNYSLNRMGKEHILTLIQPWVQKLNAYRNFQLELKKTRLDYPTVSRQTG